MKLVPMMTIGAIAIGVAMGAASAAGFRVNTTPSMPPGLWRVEPVGGPIRAGAAVTLCLPPAAAALGLERGYIGGGECPGGAELLIKEVAAVAGDTVRVGDDGITVNGAAIANSKPLQRDGRSRDVRAFGHGVYRVGPDQVWVVSTYDARSYDSRYYGPISLTDIRGSAKPFLTIH